MICRVLSILRSTTRSATLQTGMSSWGTTAMFEAVEPPAGQDAGAGEAQRGNSCWSLPSTSRIWNEEKYFYLFWFSFDASIPQHSYRCCISIVRILILYLNKLVLIKENGYFWKKNLHSQQPIDQGQPVFTLLVDRIETATRNEIMNIIFNHT